MRDRLRRPRVVRDPPVVDIDGVKNRADLAHWLDAEPDAATPALAKRLKERVEELHLTDARASRELAACVWMVAERCGDMESRALAHRARGLAAIAAGWQREVLREYEAAERLYRQLGDDAERARVLRSMIDPLMHQGRYDEALAVGREARGLLWDRGEKVLAAQVDTNIGNVYQRLDRHDESLDAYDRALGIFRTTGDEKAIAIVEFNRANVFAERNELDEAERGYRSSLRYFVSNDFQLREAQCLYSLAYVAFLRSRYTESLESLARVRRLDRELGDERHEALCSLDEGELLLTLNAWEEAGERSSEAGRMFARLAMSLETGKAALIQGVAEIHLGRTKSAAEHLDRAVMVFDVEGNAVHRGLADLYRAELKLRCRSPKSAVSFAHRAVSAFRSQGLLAKEAYARVVAGRALEDAGRPRFARRQGEAALEILSRSPSTAVEVHAHGLLARLDTDPASGRTRLETAIEAVERLRAQVVSDELHAAFQHDKVSLYEDLALQILTDGGETAAAEALAVIEAAKARVLGDVLAGVWVGRRGSGPEEIGPAWRREVEALNASYRRLNEAERGEDPRSKGVPLRREIADREERLAKLYRSWQLGRSTAEPVTPWRDPGLLDRVRGALQADEALIEYTFIGDRLHAIVCTREAARWVGEIASRERVEEAIERWLFQAGKTALGSEYREAHGEAMAKTAVAALKEMTSVMWEPVASAIPESDVRRLVIVPAGALFYIPFHALWIDGAHLIERFEISQGPSARAWLAALDLGRSVSGGALIMGRSSPELPEIEAEVAAVREGIGEATILVGDEATRTALRRHSGGVAVVHLAAHATFRGDNPLLSAIELADGRLTFYDLFDLDMDADLVVLSGCQTGRQAVLAGDELMGLARGFLYAGSASLVSSLWPIDDAATARFMSRFYDRMGRGAGPRTALGEVMREAIQAGHPPHEWAPFYLMGRPE